MVERMRLHQPAHASCAHVTVVSQSSVFNRAHFIGVVVCGRGACVLFRYRGYDAHKVVPKFAFGHGLSYSTFAYSDLTVTGLNVSFAVKNTGTVTGAEIPQLYLGFPASAGEPPQVLPGFEKVTLAPGEMNTVTFALDSGMMAVWDVAQHAWTPVQGTFGVFVGTSSRDIRLTGTLTHSNAAKTVAAWV